MSQQDRNDRLDADSIRREAAALSAHLQRVGVRWMPAAQTDQVAKLKLEMEFAVDAEPVPAPTNAATTVERADPTPRRPPPVRPATRLESVAPVSVSHDPYPGKPIAPEERQAALDQINTEVSTCTRCEMLSSCRKNTVFGEGSPNARFAFFGEGPGADEDRTGRPFVGRAGQLLTKMIEACTLQREDVYIFNTVKCRPPGNRNPEPDELANCRPYYQSQLEIIRPEYIVCLGSVSAQELLQSRLSVGRLRGTLHRYHDSKVLVTYHPAYLLRNPAAKKAAWQDLQLMLRDAGIAIN